MDQPEPFLLSPRTAQFHNLLRLCEAQSRVALTGYDGDSFMNEPKQRRLKIRTALKRMFGRRAPEPVLPEWIDESFAKRTNLQERWREVCFPQRRKDAKKERRPSAIWALNSKVWAPLFEGYDPGATKLNLELRHPFTDVRLVEYLLALPAVPWCVNKHILRLAMKDQLPAAVLNRPKTGLVGDPALQLVRRGSVRWLDSFEVNPQLKSFVNLSLRRSIADEDDSRRPLGQPACICVELLAHELPANRSTNDGKSGEHKSRVPDLNRLDCLNRRSLMERKPATDAQGNDQQIKKPYHKPEVIVYGNILEVTKNAGSKGDDDGGGGSAAGPKTGK